MIIYAESSAVLAWILGEPAAETVRTALAGALVAAAAGFVAFHVSTSGQVVTTAPAACAALSITWSPGPVPTN